MVRMVVLMLMTICLRAESVLLAQEESAASRARGQLSHLYVTLSRHTTTGFPVTSGMSLFMPEPLAFKSDASCLGFTVGAATTLFITREGYAALEVGFSRPKFSDLEVADKPFYFFDLFLHFGLSLSPDGTSAMYGSIGGALVYHSEDDEDGGPSPVSGLSTTNASSARPNYYLATTIGAFMFGVGIRYSPISRIVVNAEYKWIYDSTSEFEPVEGQPGWFYAGENRSKLDPIGNRLTLGVSYVFRIGE